LHHYEREPPNDWRNRSGEGLRGDLGQVDRNPFGGLVVSPLLTRSEQRKGNKTMTRKDYELIARVFADLNESESEGDKVSLARVARELAIELWKDNERFDGDKFLKACGL